MIKKGLQLFKKDQIIKDPYQHTEKLLQFLEDYRKLINISLTNKDEANLLQKKAIGTRKNN